MKLIVHAALLHTATTQLQTDDFSSEDETDDEETMLFECAGGSDGHEVIEMGMASVHALSGRD